MIGCLRTCVHKQPIFAFYFEFACGHVSTSSQSLRFILSLRITSSFITSGQGPGFLMGWLCLTEIEADGLSVDLSACSVSNISSLFSKPNYEIIVLLLLRKNSNNFEMPIFFLFFL